METKKGACRFCGQNKMIEVPNGYTQEEIDEEVTCECKCDEAKAYQEKKEREERLEAQKLSAQGTTFELFHNDFPELDWMSIFGKNYDTEPEEEPADREQDASPGFMFLKEGLKDDGIL